MHRGPLHYHISSSQETRFAAIEGQLEFADQDDAVVERLRAMQVWLVRARARPDIDNVANGAVGLDDAERTRSHRTFVGGYVVVVVQTGRRGGSAVEDTLDEAWVDASPLTGPRGMQFRSAIGIVRCDMMHDRGKSRVLPGRRRHPGFGIALLGYSDRCRQ